MTEPTKRDLYEEARKLEIEGRSEMSKDELSQAVEEQEGWLRSKEPEPRHPSGNWIRDHLLSLILAGLFLLSLVGQLYYQYRSEVHEALEHGQSAPEFGSSEFLTIFLASVLENWQSEFLQLFTFVILATYFIHRGSPQSRDGDDELKADIKAIKAQLGA